MMIKRQIRTKKGVIDFVLGVAYRRFKGEAVAVDNVTMDEHYLLFLDYDTLSRFDIYNIKELLKEVQELFKLSNMYIFETVNGFHVVCFDKLDPYEFLMIMNMAKPCEKFRKTPLVFGTNRWTLRISEKEGKKPKLLYTLTSRYHRYVKSGAHIKLFNKLYKRKFDDKPNDGETKLSIGKYPL